jgi:diacylglycerol kinase (ATP)
MVHLHASSRLSARSGADTESSPTRRRLLVVFNPTAGRRRQGRLAATLRHLQSAGCDLALRETTARGDAERFAREAAALTNGAAADLFVVAGGDGTINEAVNGLIAARNGVPLPALAVVPLGTANVLAQEIGLSTVPAAIARDIAAGLPRAIHIGAANGRCFTMMAGAGFDAHVVAGVSPALKRRLGKLAYVLESVRQLFRFGFPRYRVTIDGSVHDAASVIVAKGHFYGGRFVCAPEARLEAPEFQVCLFERGGRWNAVRYALALALGRLPRLGDYRIVGGRSVVIEGPPGDPVQGDGDIIARLPVCIELVSQPLRVVMPGSPTLRA